MKEKLTELFIFDQYHIAAIVCSAVLIVLIPLIGLKIKRKKQKIFITYLIYFAALQEVIDYLARFNFNGLNIKEDLPLHICNFALFMSTYALYKKHQFSFEFSYLLGVTGTFFAILTPDLSDFDDWIMYVTYFIHHALIIAFSMWNIFIDNMVPRKYSIVYCLRFIVQMAIPVGFICWLTGGNYMYLREIPNVDNPLLFGDWPFYMVNCIFIGGLLMFLAKLPFDIKNLIAKYWG
tara:strand:- start:921 stop:1625 length:705 start_codon:yes stop_codon:yes gene_type:complete